MSVVAWFALLLFCEASFTEDSSAKFTTRKRCRMIEKGGETSMPSRSTLLDEMIAATPGWRGETVARLREIIHAADPEIAEDVKWRRPGNPLGSATFEHAGIVCIAVILKERVRLSFWSGARLPDPDGRFNAQLKGTSRAIDFYEGDHLGGESLIALIRAGVALNLAKKKS